MSKTYNLPNKVDTKQSLLRDQFAAAAMTSFPLKDSADEVAIHALADRAYRIADAMLARREK